MKVTFLTTDTLTVHAGGINAKSSFDVVVLNLIYGLRTLTLMIIKKKLYLKGKRAIKFRASFYL